MQLKYKKELEGMGYDVESIESNIDLDDELKRKIKVTEEYIDFFLHTMDSIEILAKQAGFCDRCGTEGGIINFNCKFDDYQFVYIGHCMLCIVERIRKIIGSIIIDRYGNVVEVSSIINNYDLKIILTQESKTILEPQMPVVNFLPCAGCSVNVVDPREWPNSSLSGLVVENVVVHTNCVWRCAGCDKDTITRSIHTQRNRDWCELDYRRMHIECLIKAINKQSTTKVQSLSDIPNDMRCSSCNNYSLENETIYFDWMDDRECSRCANNYRNCCECNYDYNAYNMPNHDCEANQERNYDDDDDDNGDSRIRNYSYKPRPKFQGNDSYIYTGLELEIEASESRENLSDGVDIMVENKWVNAFYLKYDGSLDYGFEIVSHPHTLKAWHEVDWSFLPRLQKLGFRSWNTTSCGIHVHLGLDSFVDEAHEIRFTKVIYDNQRQVERLAGRANSGYASFEGGKGTAVKKIKNKQMDGNHFAAVNVSNGITFEIRVFKGSLRKERVLSAIEFVNAVCAYTKNLKVSYKKRPFSWGAFVSYVGNNVDTYPNLFIIINETFDNATEVAGGSD